MEAFLLGLSTGSFCITTCAPSVLPILFSEEMSGRRNAVIGSEMIRVVNERGAAGLASWKGSRHMTA